MNLPAVRIGFFLVLSVLAVAALASGVALTKRTDAAADAEHAAWGASAG